MILAFHSIFSMYGFWMPNDPRGSGSDYVALWELFRYGPATKVDSVVSVAGIPHDRARRLAAKQVLKFPPVQISGVQALTAVGGFEDACREGGYWIYALAILPEHVHAVIGRHERNIRRIVGHLKSKATMKLKECGQWSLDGRPVWGAHGWNVYLDTPSAVERAIRYVVNNPEKKARSDSDGRS